MADLELAITQYPFRDGYSLRAHRVGLCAVITAFDLGHYVIESLGFDFTRTGNWR